MTAKMIIRPDAGSADVSSAQRAERAQALAHRNVLLVW
jgi:hypothetical protein